MAGYVGRSDVSMDTRLFGGLNERATIVNLKDTEAVVCENWDPVNDGSLRTRLGYEIISAVASGPSFLANYYKTDGTEVLVSVASNTVYESINSGASWTGRGSFGTGATKPLIGTDFNGVFYLADGLNAPVRLVQGSTVTTLKNASLLPPPTGLAISSVGSPLSTAYQYVVTAVGGQGETTASAPVATVSGPATLSTSSYNIVSWSAVAGAIQYKVYRFHPADNNFYLLAALVAGTTQFLDQGQFTLNTFTAPPSVNGAYNTPADWEANGQPEGFSVLARGRNQRLLAWRGNTVWVSSLNNPLDWFSSDTFQLLIQGGIDNNITAVTTLFDYTVFFSATNAFFFQGSTSADINMAKIQGVGCVSPHSFVQLADDIFLWSQFGPTTLARIMAGADIKSDRMSQKIQVSLYASPQNKWSKVWAWHDIKNQKILWAFPSGSGSASNDNCFVFNYDITQDNESIGAWSKYTGWNIIGAVTSKDFTVYGLLSNGNFVKLHSGNTDGGAAIVADYQSGYMQRGTFMRSRLVWFDIINDPAPGSYTYSVSILGDFGQTGESQGPYVLTETSTAGDVNPWGGSRGNIHRVFTSGINRAYQIRLQANGSPNQVRVIGWRMDQRTRGTR